MAYKIRLKKIFVDLVILLGVCWVSYIFWCDSNREIPPKSSDLILSGTVYLGEKAAENAKNLLAIQPWMELYDYSSAETFYRKLQRYLLEAKQQGLLNKDTIVVFPEYIGTWLVIAGEKSDVFEANTLQDAMLTMVLSNPVKVLVAILRSQGERIIEDALFRMKSEEMLNIYSTTFFRLAREFKISIVAGSIVLPDPSVKKGKIVIRDGPLFNAGFLFRSDGKVEKDVVYKVFPIQDEQGFVAAASVFSLPVFETKLGRLAVLISSDSWYPESYLELKEKRADMIVVISFLAGDQAWNKLWRGYSAGMKPVGVKHDPETIKEGDAWHRYAIKGRLKHLSAKTAINVFLRGNFWELGSDGRTLGIHQKEIRQAGGRNGAAFLNIWL